MANVYVGFHDQRNSSRILKPPGGGSSNIFGTDAMPDVVPQNSPKRESKQSATIQQIIQTETVTKVTKTEHTNNVQNGSSVVQQNGNSTKVTSEPTTVAIQDAVPDVTAVVTSKVDEMKIEERSSKSQVSETDSAGNTKIISSDSTSEGSVQMNSNFKQGSSIGDILKHDEAEERKKIKSPAQRVPPGGYSSGLW